MSEYDPTDFVDNDFQERKTTQPALAPASGFSQRAPTREEVDTRVVEAQQKLAELKRAQEDLERERATLEETRRRQLEFQTGRQELVESLTRGTGLLEEAEFGARRDPSRSPRRWRICGTRCPKFRRSTKPPGRSDIFQHRN